MPLMGYVIIGVIVVKYAIFANLWWLKRQHDKKWL